MELALLTVMVEPSVVWITGKIVEVYIGVNVKVVVIWLQQLESKYQVNDVPGVAVRVELDALEDDNVMFKNCL